MRFCRGHGLAVRGKGQIWDDGASLSSKRVLLRASGHIPQLDGPVIAYRSQLAAIGGKLDISRACVSAEGAPLMTCSHVPQFYGLVATLHGQHFAVRRKR